MQRGGAFEEDVEQDALRETRLRQWRTKDPEPRSGPRYLAAKRLEHTRVNSTEVEADTTHAYSELDADVARVARKDRLMRSAHDRKPAMRAENGFSTMETEPARHGPHAGDAGGHARSRGGRKGGALGAPGSLEATTESVTRSTDSKGRSSREETKEDTLDNLSGSGSYDSRELRGRARMISHYNRGRSRTPTSGRSLRSGRSHSVGASRGPRRRAARSASAERGRSRSRAVVRPRLNRAATDNARLASLRGHNVHVVPVRPTLHRHHTASAHGGVGAPLARYALNKWNRFEEEMPLNKVEHLRRLQVYLWRSGHTSTALEQAVFRLQNFFGRADGVKLKKLGNGFHQRTFFLRDINGARGLELHWRKKGLFRSGKLSRFALMELTDVAKDRFKSGGPERVITVIGSPVIHNMKVQIQRPMTAQESRSAFDLMQKRRDEQGLVNEVSFLAENDIEAEILFDGFSAMLEANLSKWEAQHFPGPVRLNLGDKVYEELLMPEGFEVEVEEEQFKRAERGRTPDPQHFKRAERGRTKKRKKKARGSSSDPPAPAEDPSARLERGEASFWRETYFALRDQVLVRPHAHAGGYAPARGGLVGMRRADAGAGAGAEGASTHSGASDPMSHLSKINLEKKVRGDSWWYKGQRKLKRRTSEVGSLDRGGSEEGDDTWWIKEARRREEAKAKARQQHTQAVEDLRASATHDLDPEPPRRDSLEASWWPRRPSEAGHPPQGASRGRRPDAGPLLAPDGRRKTPPPPPPKAEHEGFRAASAPPRGLVGKTGAGRRDDSWWRKAERERSEPARARKPDAGPIVAQPERTGAQRQPTQRQGAEGRGRAEAGPQTLQDRYRRGAQHAQGAAAQEQRPQQGAPAQQRYQAGSQVQQRYQPGAQAQQQRPQQGAQVQQRAPQGSQAQQRAPPGAQVQQRAPPGSQVQQRYQPGSQVQQRYQPGSQVEQRYQPGAPAQQQRPQPGAQVQQRYQPGSQVQQRYPPGTQQAQQRNPPGAPQAPQRAPPGSQAQQRYPPGSQVQQRYPPGAPAQQRPQPGVPQPQAPPRGSPDEAAAPAAAGARPSNPPRAANGSAWWWSRRAKEPEAPREDPTPAGGTPNRGTPTPNRGTPTPTPTPKGSDAWWQRRRADDADAPSGVTAVATGALGAASSREQLPRDGPSNRGGALRETSPAVRGANGGRDNLTLRTNHEEARRDAAFMDALQDYVDGEEDEVPTPVSYGDGGGRGPWPPPARGGQSAAPAKPAGQWQASEKGGAHAAFGGIRADPKAPARRWPTVRTGAAPAAKADTRDPPPPNGAQRPGSGRQWPPGSGAAPSNGAERPGSGRQWPPGSGAAPSNGADRPGSTSAPANGADRPGSGRQWPPGSKAAPSNGAERPGSGRQWPPGSEAAPSNGAERPGSGRQWPPGSTSAPANGADRPGSGRQWPPAPTTGIAMRGARRAEDAPAETPRAAPGRQWPPGAGGAGGASANPLPRGAKEEPRRQWPPAAAPNGRATAPSYASARAAEAEGAAGRDQRAPGSASASANGADRPGSGRQWPPGSKAAPANGGGRPGSGRQWPPGAAEAPGGIERPPSRRWAEDGAAEEGAAPEEKEAAPKSSWYWPFSGGAQKDKPQEKGPPVPPRPEQQGDSEQAPYGQRASPYGQQQQQQQDKKEAPYGQRPSPYGQQQQGDSRTAPYGQRPSASSQQQQDSRTAPYGQRPSPYSQQQQQADKQTPYGQRPSTSAQQQQDSRTAPYGQRPSTASQQQQQDSKQTPYGQRPSTSAQQQQDSRTAPYGQRPSPYSQQQQQDSKTAPYGQRPSPYSQQQQEKKETPYGQRPSPYSQQQQDSKQTPYGQRPSPYAQQQQRQEDKPTPYGQRPSPYAQQQKVDGKPTPYGQRPSPYGQQQQQQQQDKKETPYGQRPSPYGQRPSTSSQQQQQQQQQADSRTAPYGQRPSPYSQQQQADKQAPYGQRPSPYSQQPQPPQRSGAPQDARPAPYGRQQPPPFTQRSSAQARDAAPQSLGAAGAATAQRYREQKQQQDTARTPLPRAGLAGAGGYGQEPASARRYNGTQALGGRQPPPAAAEQPPASAQPPQYGGRSLPPSANQRYGLGGAARTPLSTIGEQAKQQGAADAPGAGRPRAATQYGQPQAAAADDGRRAGGGAPGASAMELEREFQKRRIRPLVRDALRRKGVTDMEGLRRLTIEDIQGLRLARYDEQKVKQMLGAVQAPGGGRGGRVDL